MPTEPTKKSTAAHRPRAAAHPATEHKPVVHAERYTEAVGRRKTAIARVRISKGEGAMQVNGMEAKKYFALPRLVTAAKSPAERLGLGKDFDVTVQVSGGGIHAQAEAIRLGYARAIIKLSPEWRKQLRAVGFLTRDSRMVERKKYGLKKARRSPQWAKR
jgi:small subunit ribosomal protein S9